MYRSLVRGVLAFSLLHLLIAYLGVRGWLAFDNDLLVSIGAMGAVGTLVCSLILIGMKRS